MKNDARWMTSIAPSATEGWGAAIATPLSWLELTKPRIGLFVILAAFTGGALEIMERKRRTPPPCFVFSSSSSLSSRARSGPCAGAEPTL